MKLYDPAVVEGLAVAADLGRVGPIRSIEVRVLHPTSERQLAHARLLPPPDRYPARDDRPGCATRANGSRRRRSDPPPRPSAASTRTSCSGASSTSWRSSGPSPATRSASMPWTSGPMGSGHRRSRSMAGSPAARVSPSAGTSCRTTRPTARRCGSSPSRPPSSWSSRRRTFSTPRPTCGSRISRAAPATRRWPPGHALPVGRRGVRGGAPGLPRPGRGRDRPKGGHRRGTRRHRHVAADHRPSRRQTGLPVEIEAPA